MPIVAFKMDASNVFQKLILLLESFVTFVTIVLLGGFYKIVNKQLSDKNKVKNK